MSKKEMQMYTVECNNCGETYKDDHSGFVAWKSFNSAWDNASESDWIEQDGKHYCSQCYTIDDDDNTVIDESRFSGLINVLDMKEGQVGEIVEWFYKDYIGAIVERVGNSLIFVDKSDKWTDLFLGSNNPGCTIRLINN